MKRSIVILLFVLALALLAFVPKAEDPIERFVSALQRWSDVNPQEKVYLHTDKPYYVLGDTIWFKGYVTIGSKNHLSKLSGALYVELVNEKDSVAKLLKLPITAGMAKGCFALDPQWPEGNYRLRSYTQWMRNQGPDYFYDKTFLVKPGDSARVFTNIDYTYSKEGENNYYTAILSYTNSAGRPLSFLPIKFNLRKNYNTIYKGQGRTNEKGELRLVFKTLRPEDIAGSHLVTSIELEDYAVVFKTFPIKNIAMEPDIRFFPEGGEFIDGLNTRMAVKVVGVNGLGLAAKGTVVDENNKELAAFVTNRFGMGSFFLKPGTGKAYKAKIVYPNGLRTTVGLPSATPYGYSMAVNYNAESDLIDIQINGVLPFPRETDKMYILLQSGGEVIHTDVVSMKAGQAAIKLSASGFPSGITQVTLFSSTGEPLNERIIFIQHNDQLQVKLSSDKSSYTTRGPVELQLEAADAAGPDVIANFSVAVVNEDAVPVNELKENTIFSHLLLSTELKGYIEQPNYYFYRPGAATRKDLDLLMLTQGYRRFSWKEVMNGHMTESRYPAEKLVTEVSGKLVSLWKGKVPFGKVYMINNKLGIFLIANTDEAGRFKFSDLIITEGLRFSVHGRKKNNTHRLEVLLDKYGLQPMTKNVNIPDAVTDFRKVILQGLPELSHEEQMRLQQRLAVGKMLKEVKIKARMRRPGLDAIKGQISQSIIFDERDFGKSIAKALNDRELAELKVARGLTGWRAYLRETEMDILINDKYMGNDAVDDVMDWDAQDVIKVDLVRNEDVVKPTMLVYTRSIYVKNPINPSDPNSRSKWTPDMINIFPRGFDRVKEFYVPKYDIPQAGGAKPDRRTTIYWNPSVILRNGRAIVRFFTGDRKGKYRVVAEGVSSDGLVGRQLYHFRVE